MITTAMIGKVKRMHFREKKSVREIVRLTSLSRNTVRKWSKAPVLKEPVLRLASRQAHRRPCRRARPQRSRVGQEIPDDRRRSRYGVGWICSRLL